MRELKRLASKQGCIQNGKRDKMGIPGKAYDSSIDKSREENKKWDAQRKWNSIFACYQG